MMHFGLNSQRTGIISKVPLSLGWQHPTTAYAHHFCCPPLWTFPGVHGWQISSLPPRSWTDSGWPELKRSYPWGPLFQVNTCRLKKSKQWWRGRITLRESREGRWVRKGRGKRTWTFLSLFCFDRPTPVNLVVCSSITKPCESDYVADLLEQSRSERETQECIGPEPSAALARKMNVHKAIMKNYCFPGRGQLQQDSFWDRSECSQLFCSLPHLPHPTPHRQVNLKLQA